MESAWHEYECNTVVDRAGDTKTAVSAIARQAPQVPAVIGQERCCPCTNDEPSRPTEQ